MSWDRVIGQRRIKEILQRLLETGKLPHALLFYGPEGTGQDAAAIELAKAVNCENNTVTPCGICPNCKQIGELRHPRLKLVFPLPVKPGEESALEKMTPQELEEINEQIGLKAENPYHRISIPKATVIKVSSIRDIIRESAFRSSGKGRTVVVILDADQMNQNAANALLKSLEEPSGDVMFILTTSNRDTILPTIRSRCQQLRFDPLTPDEIMAGLRAESRFAEDRIATAAQLASGSYTAAHAIAAEEGGADSILVRDYLRQVMMNKPAELMAMLQDIVKNQDRKQIISFLAMVQFWFRDIVAIHQGMPEKVLFRDIFDSLDKFAQHYPHAGCAEAIELIENTIEMIPKNVHLMNALIVLSHRLKKAITRKNVFAHV